MIKAILFDLDGTLLPMDYDKFIKSYFGGLSKKLAPYGYNPDELIDGILQGIKVMVNNNGEKTNKQVFWDKFTEVLGERVIKDEQHFAEFYKNEFNDVQKVCGFNEKSKIVIDYLKQKGFTLVLATNPLFPSIATESRIKWAGLDKNDFKIYTTYENYHHSKPNIEYYLEITKKLGIKPEECLMVGNDVREDMIAKDIGMKVFLITDCLICDKETNINNFPNGNLDDLINYIKKIEDKY